MTTPQAIPHTDTLINSDTHIVKNETFLHRKMMSPREMKFFSLFLFPSFFPLKSISYFPPFFGLRGHLKHSLGWGIPSKVKESTIPDRKRIYQPRKVFLGDILFRCRKSINIFSIFLNLDDQHEKLLPLQSIKPLLRIFHN